MRWLPVVGYESLYEVSDEGHVFSKVTDRMMRPDASGGYFRVMLSGFGSKRRYLVHRLVLAAFIGPAADQQGNHKDGNKINNRLSNLEYCSRSENGVHACRVLNTHRQKGQNHGRSKLTNEQALQIYKLRKLGEPLLDIAAMFNVCIGTVSLIANGKTWGSVTGAFPRAYSR